MNQYAKFGLMMLTSFIIMYAVMYLNVDQLDHIYTAQTRTYMTILMIAPMAISMLLFMWSMYENKRLNYLILGSAVLVGVFTFYILREQTFVGDKAWIRAMIPHHSSAIMVSQEADLQDPEAIQLAKEIIEAQKREIAEMKKMLYRLEQAE
ncbi:MULTISPECIES: DUF305 domain-containing protein [Phaeodactylibacter]|jgi:archaellum component FlaF (FlaF/FlaG flagellin family)|uniref:DUF305 domain-containing protein n=1 Tax=Phaeodactylibacter luteus TaxID=1564516 RepID=A0A5C6RJK4_9BACT|nr:MULTISPECIES: DUF305 domain-containing protein [Phaeodactylibacter]TXB62313.1 DUF305 domain-containing protein [Phaeodactylibacter luteus]